MMPKSFMFIAGETSGDLLAAELAMALRRKCPEAAFFGAGGPKMAAAGVDLAFDLTKHSVIGITDVLKSYFKFRRFLKQLLALAIERKPDVIIGIDYGGFNLRLGHAIRRQARNSGASWNPKIVQFVSPQVWATRAKRADRMAADYDLLLSIFPFEKAWYARRVPKFRVDFIGHPMIDRIGNFADNGPARPISQTSPRILLLPGSRIGELQRHLPPMLEAWKLIQKKLPAATANMVLPNESLKALATAMGATVNIQIGNLATALKQTDVAIASTGTVTMECAFFGMPTVTMYKTSTITYEIVRRMITVKTLTMPNILAGEKVYPEFVQHDATAENISQAALKLLEDGALQTKIKSQLAAIVASLGQPGAAGRAADSILSLFT
jgi:lipid-A-disaccharide synthase